MLRTFLITEENRADLLVECFRRGYKALWIHSDKPNLICAVDMTWPGDDGNRKLEMGSLPIGFYLEFTQ